MKCYIIIELHPNVCCSGDGEWVQSWHVYTCKQVPVPMLVNA